MRGFLGELRHARLVTITVALLLWSAHDSFPGTDLHVTLDGIEIKPVFAPMHGGAMMMGDLVLLGTEVDRAVTKLLDAGLEVTALHHHLLRAESPVYFMHIGGHGDPVALDAAMGVPGQSTGQANQFAVLRREPIVEHGLEVTAPMGGANVIAFQPIGGGRVAATGDFVLTGLEVNPLVRTLRGHGIEVTAIHAALP